jgi:hypothetical protein
VGDTRTLHSTSDNAGSCVCFGLFLGCISAPTEQRPDNDRARKNPVLSDRLMRDARGGLGDIPSLGKAGAPPASARSRRVKAREQVCGPKGRPFQQWVIAVCRALPWCDLTPKQRVRHAKPIPRFWGMADYVDIAPAFTRNMMSCSEVMADWFAAIGTLVLAVVAVLQELIRG